MAQHRLPYAAENILGNFLDHPEPYAFPFIFHMRLTLSQLFTIASKEGIGKETSESQRLERLDTAEQKSDQELDDLSLDIVGITC